MTAGEGELDSEPYEAVLGLGEHWVEAGQSPSGNSKLPTTSPTWR